MRISRLADPRHDTVGRDLFANSQGEALCFLEGETRSSSFSNWGALRSGLSPESGVKRSEISRKGGFRRHHRVG